MSPASDARVRVHRLRDRPLLSYFGQSPVDPKRSAMLSRVRGKDTKPEIALRKAIWAEGARFRLHPADVPGRPDIANRRAKVAVFVDGCFWHGCPKHFKPPKTRRAFWTEKIRRNRSRRAEVLYLLRPTWRVFEVYECELRERGPQIARGIARAINSAAPRSSTLRALRTRRA